MCGPQGWEFDLKWRLKGGKIDIDWKPGNVKLPVDKFNKDFEIGEDFFVASLGHEKSGLLF